jgi:hypothetical protein
MSDWGWTGGCRKAAGTPWGMMPRALVSLGKVGVDLLALVGDLAELTVD